MFACKVADNIELRLHEERYVPDLWALTEADRAHARRWLPWVDNATSSESSREFIQRSLSNFAKGEQLSMGIWVGGKLVGGIGFNRIDKARQLAEIGYWLAEWMEGRGIMTRCVRRLCDHGFAELKLHRIEIRCAVENLRSRAIPERLGFTHEGTLRETAQVNGVWESHAIYGMLASEWEKKQQDFSKSNSGSR